MSDLDKLEADARVALLAWLRDHPVRSPETGNAMQWPDGRPVALDVLQVIEALRRGDAA